MSTEELSPWETTQQFFTIWNLKDVGWLAITVALVFFIHKIATAKRKREKPHWVNATLWVLSIVGWAFLLYLVVWEKIKEQYAVSLFLLIVSLIGSYLALALLFRKEENSVYKSRIASAVVSAIIIFTAISLMAVKQMDLGIAMIMGMTLGFFISQLVYNLTHMGNYQPEEDDKDDSSWDGRSPPPV